MPKIMRVCGSRLNDSTHCNNNRIFLIGPTFWATQYTSDHDFRIRALNVLNFGPQTTKNRSFKLSIHTKSIFFGRYGVANGNDEAMPIFHRQRVTVDR